MALRSCQKCVVQVSEGFRDSNGTLYLLMFHKFWQSSVYLFVVHRTYELLHVMQYLLSVPVDRLMKMIKEHCIV